MAACRGGSPLLLGPVVERARVHAPALTGGPGPVVEDVPQVPAATPAPDLGADHSVGAVVDQLDGVGGHGLGEAGPSGSRLELRVRGEQFGAAAGTVVDPVVVEVPVATRERRLGAGAPQHGVLLRCQLAPPLLIGLFNGLGHEGEYDGG